LAQARRPAGPKASERKNGMKAVRFSRTSMLAEHFGDADPIRVEVTDMRIVFSFDTDTMYLNDGDKHIAEFDTDTDEPTGWMIGGYDNHADDGPFDLIEVI